MMVSTDPRTRLLTVRLSQEEYEQVKKICRERRIRTVSEFTRIAVAHEITGTPALGGTECSMAQLDVRMEKLGESVERLVRALEAVASEVRHKGEYGWGSGS
jgi:hypothetical protein